MRRNSKFRETKGGDRHVRVCGLLVVAEAAISDVNGSSCPCDAIAVVPGASIQAAVDFAGDGAAFCLRKGIHRAQAIRPRPKQRFYGEGKPF